MDDFKIIDVISLVPVQVKYSRGDGEIQTIFGYIDYSTYEVYVEEYPQNISIDDFKSLVADFLLGLEQKTTDELLKQSVPKEVYDQIRKKPEIQDYIPKNLPECASIRLKENDGKS